MPHLVHVTVVNSPDVCECMGPSFSCSSMVSGCYCPMTTVLPPEPVTTYPMSSVSPTTERATTNATTAQRTTARPSTKRTTTYPTTTKRATASPTTTKRTTTNPTTTNHTTVDPMPGQPTTSRLSTLAVVAIAVSISIILIIVVIVGIIAWRKKAHATIEMIPLAQLANPGFSPGSPNTPGSHSTPRSPSTAGSHGNTWPRNAPPAILAIDTPARVEATATRYNLRSKSMIKPPRRLGFD